MKINKFFCNYVNSYSNSIQQQEFTPLSPQKDKLKRPQDTDSWDSNFQT